MKNEVDCKRLEKVELVDSVINLILCVGLIVSLMFILMLNAQLDEF